MSSKANKKSKQNKIDEDNGWDSTPQGVKLFIYFLAFIVLYTISQIIMIRTVYKPLFDWWANNGGDKYNNQINLFNVVSAYYSRYLYYLSLLRTTPVGALTLSQTNFLMGDLFPYQTWVTSDGKANGCLTPRAVCESIKPAPGQGDAIFDDWFSKLAIINDEPQDYNSKLIYDSDGIPQKDPKTGKYGVYPSSKDFVSWKGLISEWLGDGWKWEIRKDGDSAFEVPVPKDGSIDNNLASWYSGDVGRGDNFLARMGINPDCPLIVYFVNGTYSVNGMVVDAVAFENLLEPFGPNAGGWLGYMRGMGDVSPDDYKKYVRTRVDSQPIPKPAPCEGKTGKGVLAFFASAAPLIGFAVSTGGIGGIAIGIAALTAGGISAAQTVQSC